MPSSRAPASPLPTAPSGPPRAPAWVLLLALLAGPAGLASAAAPADREAFGLIVRLKQASANDTELRRELQRGSRAGREDAPRWVRALSESALTGRSGQREPALRDVGRDQQLLDFGRVLAPDEAERLAARLRAHPAVDWVAPNVRERRLQVPPTDPFFNQQWWLQLDGGSNASALADRRRGVAGFLRAWQSGIAGATGSAAATVAVLDTGITAHPDLGGRVLPGYDFVSDPLFANDGNGRDADPSDPGDWVSAADRGNSRFASCAEQRSSWHGTLVAGLVAATPNNAEGVAGVMLQGRVLPVRVAGKCGATVADIVDGLRWAAGLPVAGVPANANPARILNVSFGGSSACGPEYQAAIDEVRNSRGAVVVAAAGNEFGAPTRPANCSGVVGVAAINRDGFKTHYSNFGAALAASGIAAPGGDDNQGGTWKSLADGGIVSVWNDGTQGPGSPSYAALFGTSFAAPQVSGTLALMLAVNPALSAEQLIAGLRAAARPHVSSPLIGACSEANPGRCICSTATCGAGILDAEQALRFAQSPGSYVAPARQPAVIDNPEVAAAVALGPDRGSGSGGGGGGGGGGGSSSGGGPFAPAWALALLGAALALRRQRAA